MQRVINFSGGKTSACMTIMLYQPGDIVLFCDTGREHPGTYDFIKRFEINEHIPITKISFPGKIFDWAIHNQQHPFQDMLKKKDYKRIPNRMMRSCTEELKVNTAKRYLKSIGVIRFTNFIGFRFDEPLRVNRHIEKFKKVITSFPLYEMKITKQIINDFWAQKGYTLEIPSILGNCDLCFMKGKNVIISILRNNPELADKWINDEEESTRHFGHTYLPGISFKEMLELSKQPFLKQQDLFELQPAFNCACTT